MNVLEKLVFESEYPEITKKIYNKSIICVYPFGTISRTNNRIHINILKEYKKRWINKQVLTDIHNLMICIVSKYNKVYAICSSTEYSIIKLIKLLCFNFEKSGYYNEKHFNLYSLGGVNNV